MTIYHIAHVSEWADALQEGEYRVSTSGLSLDEVGFIHASTREQVAPTAERFYRDVTAPLCVLVIDEGVGTEVREEEGDDGQRYPHIYGVLKPDWVVDARPAGFGEDGRFNW
ncbi:DUF952 domain-containing protein [Corynebacterium sp.]|uniref:DUF952 domain-containing protein n=1 Tax=Corynebacterium sp. TaxID=1720 RepID=UPI003B3AF11B